VNAKGWTKVIHYWRAGSKCSEVYNVRGVPHIMIIDTNGKIAYAGHPAKRPDLAADLTKLLAGEPMTGAGCAPAEPKEGEVVEFQMPEGYKEATDESIAAIHAEMDAFRG